MKLNLLRCVRHSWVWVKATMLAALFATASAPASAIETVDNVYFAGFSFSSNYSNIEALYPYSVRLAAEENGIHLDVLLKKVMDRTTVKNKLRYDDDDGKKESNAATFALVEERFETQELDGKVLFLTNLATRVLIYNRATKSLVASYPFRVRTTKLLDAMPDDATKLAAVREIYEGNDERTNIFSLWAERLDRLKLRKGATRFLKVMDVHITPDARAKMDGEALQPIQNQIANYLEMAISEAADVSIIPYTAGQAIGQKISARFANGRDIEIVLPDPDYSIRFKVRDFAAARVDKGNVDQDVYRAKASIAISQDDSGKVYLNEDIYGTTIVNLAKRMNVKISAWNQYYKTLESLIFLTGKQLANCSDGYLAENASRAAEAKAAFLNANQLILSLK